MNLDDFERELRQRIGESQNLRPFVCEGSPWNARYSSSASIRRRRCLEVSGIAGAQATDSIEELGSKSIRRKEPRKNAETNSVIHAVSSSGFSKASRMRNASKRISYSFATPSARELPDSEREAEIFKFLLDAIKPKVIVAHGKEAGELLERSGELASTYGVPAGNRLPAVLIKKSHFSRGWSREKARELGHLINAKCNT